MDTPIVAPENHIAKGFQWRTHKGELLSPSDMTTSHLFYTVRMLFNHTVSSELRIPNCKRWIIKASLTYRCQAIQKMLNELRQRHDVEDWMLLQLETMRLRCRANLQLKLA